MGKTYKVGCYYKVLIGKYSGLVGKCTRLSSDIDGIELQIGDTGGTMWYSFNEVDEVTPIGMTYKVIVGNWRGNSGICVKIRPEIKQIVLDIDGSKLTYHYDEVEMIQTKVNHIGKKFQVSNMSTINYCKIGTCIGNEENRLMLSFADGDKWWYPLEDLKEVKDTMKTPKHDSFYLVWSPTGKTPPTCRHTSQYDAEVEAKRLASSNPGTQFFVLETKYSVTNGKTEEKTYTTPDNTHSNQIPF